ncbi:type II secretion system protein GspL [Microbulbifer thermotolerans]|uniref:type II secretion system protein GspL n=1 Tax=Microbulbifer thermotolerans TaxID=252514 RepID=UPI0022487A94|nr:type II secretion system protein GspL [Microbulbifer thermotolerans]MCX2794925.1 type II secretion system protein GspL [Microbulbifer thermotolerans]
MIAINKFHPVKSAPASAPARQLMLLRLSCPDSGDRRLQLQCWSRDGWRAVALDDDFVCAFCPDGDLASEENALQLSFPEGARALLLVPGNWVWTGLETIPKAARRQSRAIGYMVEERLAEDVEELHFVCQARRGDTCSVYAAATEKMEALHSQLQRLGWPVAAVLPEYQLLDLLEGDIVLWLDGAQAHIWHKKGYGLSVRRQYLQPLLGSLRGDEEGAPRIQLLGAGDGDGMILAELESLFGDQLELIEGPAEEVMLARCKLGPLVNLMTGEFELAGGEEERNWWHRPVKVAAACFVAQLLLFAAAGGYFQWRASNAEQQARALFTELFPQDRPGVDIRRQIEGYLKRASASGGGFGSQMQLLSRVWEQQKGRDLKLQSLRFDGNRGEMVLQLQAANLTDLDTLVSRLSEGEFRADLLGANELEKGVSGRIRLR